MGFPLISLAPPHFVLVPWPGPGFPMSYVVWDFFFILGTLKLERFGKSNNFKMFGSNEIKKLKQGQNQLRSSMSGFREHYLDNTKLFYLNTVYHFGNNIR